MCCFVHAVLGHYLHVMGDDFRTLTFCGCCTRGGHAKFQVHPSQKAPDRFYFMFGVIALGILKSSIEKNAATMIHNTAVHEWAMHIGLSV